ncbi:MAG: AAA domain-containing protein [Minicystis sp.]
MSVYDWLTALPSEHFDVSPLRELSALSPLAVRDAVRPFVGILKKQYRMHSSLSRVPRAWFYFGNALHDGKPDTEVATNRATLKQVDSPAVITDGGESNLAEAEAICTILERLNAIEGARQRRPGIMVITPYRHQEALLEQAIGALRDNDSLTQLDVEICTLDRCQGREAEYVFISLVRNRATRFMDMPKRWIVALTRARAGLFILGDINAYLETVRAERRSPGRHAPTPSLIARLLGAYAGQIAELRR